MAVDLLDSGPYSGITTAPLPLRICPEGYQLQQQQQQQHNSMIRSPKAATMMAVWRGKPSCMEEPSSSTNGLLVQRSAQAVRPRQAPSDATCTCA